MCGFVPKDADLTKKTAFKAAFFIREMFSKKEEAPAAFDFVSPPKKEEQPEKGKACSAA